MFGTLKDSNNLIVVGVLHVAAIQIPNAETSDKVVKLTCIHRIIRPFQQLSTVFFGDVRHLYPFNMMKYTRAIRINQIRRPQDFTFSGLL